MLSAPFLIANQPMDLDTSLLHAATFDLIYLGDCILVLISSRGIIVWMEARLHYTMVFCLSEVA